MKRFATIMLLVAAGLLPSNGAPGENAPVDERIETLEQRQQELDKELRELRDEVKRASDGKAEVEQAGFAVLKAPDIPSILVETAFISNPDEEKKLRNPKYQEQMARAILAGIRQYFTDHPPAGREVLATNP